MRLIVILSLLLSSLPAAAQFTTAEAVRPILDATKANWVAVRRFNGQDLLYFTHLESWRCGLEAVLFGVNGAPPVALYDLAPCDPSNPNAIPEGHLPYLAYEENSIQSVTVQVVYDDGVVSEVSYPRAAVEIP